MLVFGLGPRKYQVKRDWGRLPSHLSLKSISAIEVDQHDNVFVLQRSRPFLLLFTSEGELIDAWDNDYIADGHYLYVTPEDRVIVVDRDFHRLIVFNKEGEVIDVIGERHIPGLPGEPFNHPTDMVMTRNGHYYVTDGYGNSCVHHFDPSWKRLNTWGERGSENGAFSTPHAIATDSYGRLLVTDRENNRIQFFNQDGNYLKEIGNVYHPMDIWIDKEGLIYVTDQTPSINMFSPEGEWIGRCRTFGIYGHGITVDSKGDIYIAEMFPDGITKLVLNHLG